MDKDQAQVHNAAITDSVTRIIEFFYNLSFVFFRNEEAITEFEQRSLDVIANWHHEAVQGPLFLQKNLDTNEIDVVAKLADAREFRSNILIVIKNHSIIDEDVPIELQFNTVLLPKEAEFEALKALVDFGISEVFEQFVCGQTNTPVSNSELLVNAKRRIKDLSISLHNLDDEIQVPDIEGSIHPMVKRIVSEGAMEETIEDFCSAKEINDSTFLNNLQKISNMWIKSILTLVRLERNLEDGTSLDEFHFWKNFNRALTELDRRINSTEVKVTIAILSSAKRFQATNFLTSDNGLHTKIRQSHAFSTFLSNFSLEKIFSAASLVQLHSALISFSAEFKKLKATQYPLERAVGFVELLTRDIKVKIMDLLPNPLTCDYEEFVNLNNSISNLLDNWDEQMKDVTIILRELMRKRAEKFNFVKLSLATDDLRYSFKTIQNFRSYHQKFMDVLEEMKLGKHVEKLANIYDSVKIINPLKLSIDSWKQVEIEYNDHVFAIEDDITTVLRSELSKTISTEEIISVFEQYMLLMDRPRISGAVREFMHKLLINIKRDLTNLRSTASHSISVSDFRIEYDNDSFTSELLKRKKMNAKLSALDQSLTNILGKDWKDTMEAKEINEEYLVLHSMFDFKELYSQWIESLQKRFFSTEHHIVKILYEDSCYEMHVNFDKNDYRLYKEVRVLIWNGFEIPTSILKTARITRQIYPHAVMLNDMLKTFFMVLECIQDKQISSILLAPKIENIWSILEDLVLDTWRTVPIFANTGNDNLFETSTIFKFEEDVQNLLDDYEYLERIEMEMKTFFKEFEKINIDNLKESKIERLQTLVDTLSVKNYNNIIALVNFLNENLKSLLLEKMSLAIQNCDMFNIKQKISYLHNNFNLEPSPSFLKGLWIHHVDQVLQKGSKQKKIRISTLSDTKRIEECFSRQDLQLALKNHILDFFQILNETAEDSDKHLSYWQNLQGLWYITEKTVIELVDEDLGNALELVSQILDEKKVITELPVRVTLRNGMTLDQEKVQTLCLQKHEIFESMVVEKLISLYMKKSTEFHKLLLDYRSKLEESNLADMDIIKVAEIVSILYEVNERTEYYDSEYDLLKCCQRLLIQNRYKLPKEFIYIEQIKLDLDTLKQLSVRLSHILDENRNVIVCDLDREIVNTTTASLNIREQWDKCKLLSANTDPVDMLKKIFLIKDSIIELEKQKEQLAKIGKLLLVPVLFNEDPSNILDEVQFYQSLWQSITEYWNSIQNAVNIPWLHVDLAVVERKLKDLLEQSNTLPPTVLQYSVFQDLLQSITTMLDSLKIISSLHTCGMKGRHWNELFEKLGNHEINSQKIEDQTFTLTDILSLNIEFNVDTFNDVINKARDEQLIEKSLIEIKERWKLCKLETFQHKSGQKLVKNWENLYSLSSDDIALLISTKHSPYYKIFEQEIFEWEAKLSEFSEVLLNGLDTQKQWSYLFGVLGTDNDLKNQLQMESYKFSNLTLEFNAIFRILIEASSPLDVLHTNDYLVTLKRLLESLTTVRTSLYDFLESQRNLFPRFYFMGNEDLLQLLGSQNCFSTISNHVRKMFPCIDQVIVNNGFVTSIVSPQCERINFQTPIKVSSYSKLHEIMTVFEKELKCTLANLLEDCLTCFSFEKFIGNIVKYPFQVLLLALQIHWTNSIEKQESDHETIVASLTNLSKQLLQMKMNATEDYLFLKLESLITEVAHMTQCTSSLLHSASKSMDWNNTQRFYYLKDITEPFERVIVKQTGIEMLYGFEYIGIPESLIHTPLLEKCFSTMLHALSKNLGGSPFGPAGTGKTETIKFLGQRLGRYVLVFNCDDTFDYQSLNRILFGITQVGAWGCFDEFNRLDKNLLSAVSSQIEVIQSSLLKCSPRITILGREGSLNSNCGLFITMNLGYVGRTELPGNLKSMFREFALTAPENTLIVSTILTGIGFSDPTTLSKKLVTLFDELKSRTTERIHYDFGLRAIKSVLRKVSSEIRISNAQPQESHLLQSVYHVISPKLVDEDRILFQDLLNTLFPNIRYYRGNESFSTSLRDHCAENGLVLSSAFETKCLELFEIQKSNQGIILIGEAGCGKTCVINSVAKTIQKLFGEMIVIFTLPTKAFTKVELFGSLDPITYEWKDGLFASILRDVSSDALGKYKNKSVWIVFDSELDPQYTETLNSVLDDNKILTLPNGERLRIPENIRLIFEVDNLQHATPATVSRCGIIWFNPYVISRYEFLLSKVRHSFSNINISAQHTVIIQNAINTLVSVFDENMLKMIFENAKCYSHVMGFEDYAVLSSISSLYVSDVVQNSAFLNTLNEQDLRKYLLNRITLITLWCFAGGCSIEEKLEFSRYLTSLLKPLGLTEVDGPLLDYNIPENSIDFSAIRSQVNALNLETHEVLSADIIIPTIDTFRHEDILFRFLHTEKPLILCGPPGSGKTMTLFSALKKSDKFTIFGMNFCKDTTVDFLLKTIEQHTAYHSSPEGRILEPKVFGKELVFFCDEINLPKIDQYGTQPVIEFLRHLIERKGFWNTKENSWVTLRRIKFIAACNPPSDPGRNEMTKRFTRHCTTLMVDYPAKDSLVQIYSTLFSATLKMAPLLKNYSEPLAHASIDIYYACKSHFTVGDQQHYVFSPRELTRCVRGIYYALENSSKQDLEFLLKIWFDESRRILGDRLVSQEEKNWLDSTMENVVLEHFPNPNLVAKVIKPILLSSWINSKYEEIDEERLQNFVSERIKTFCEEELGNDIIVHREMMQNMLKIDRVLKQVQGHAMLIAPSGSGKTTIVRFVSWLNAITVRVPEVHRNFTLEDFDVFLRNILVECGVNDQKTCLLLDESKMLDTSFIERMNTLLANSDIPGLFEEDELNNLFSKIRNKVQSLGLLLDTRDEMYDWFKSQISKRLHVIFTINDPTNHTCSKLIASPALFNRCVINWMGQWSVPVLNYVADHIIGRLPLDCEESHNPEESKQPSRSYREVISSAFVSSFEYYQSLDPRDVSPSVFLDSLWAFKKQYLNKLEELDGKNRFVKVGLDKLRETLLKVKQLNVELQEKKAILSRKESEARTTLDKMLLDQNKSERKEEASIEIQKILAEQEKSISSRRDLVMEELATVEPAITEAQKGVKNIKKQQLTELRTMLNPPSAVKITLEAVCIVLGFQCSSWRDIQQTIRKDDFITRIVTFDTETMLPDSLKDRIKETYLNKPNFTLANVQRASQACGPLFQWILAQISYSDILLKVAPLKRDLSILESEILKTRAKLIAADEMIKELRAQIEESKRSYTSLIRDGELIKTEISSVEKKVLKSVTLVESLKSEKERWMSETLKFKELRKKLAGNTIISSFYSVYASAHEHGVREQLLSFWKNLLSSCNIAYTERLDYCQFNIDSSSRAFWCSLGLPDDDFFVENFEGIINTVRDKYPFIIDPEGSVFETLLAYYGNKLILTSFLDNSFLKQLENAMRFGGVLFIQDGEFFDPLIMKVLKKEFKNSAGRLSIEIGPLGRTVDVAKNFQLLIYTRDKNWDIPEFVKAKCHVFDLTITKGNLETQLMQKILAKEVPQLQDERLRLLERNSMFTIQLEKLGTKLLTLLNESEGNLLDNDDLVQTLEDLNVEATKTKEELVKIGELVDAQDNIVKDFSPLAKEAVQIFDLLQCLKRKRHWFYDVNVKEFLEVLDMVFEKRNNSAEKNRTYIESLFSVLYRVTYCTFGGMFLEKDMLIFGLMLFDMYCKRNESLFTIEQWSSLKQDIESLRYEEDLPDLFLTLRNGLISGNTFDSLHQFLLKFMGNQNPWTLEDIHTVNLSTKIVLVASDRGVDGSFKIQSLSNRSNRNIYTVSMGTTESCNMAEENLLAHMDSGGWIVLQNIQMSIQWCEEKLPRFVDQIKYNSHPNFKLFLTCDLSDVIHPGSQLLQNCKKFSYEGESGVLHNVKKFWQLIVNDKPAESTFSYLKHLICWIHAIILERVRITNLNIQYRDIDFELAIASVDDSVSGEFINWEKLRFLVGPIIYCNRTDDTVFTNWLVNLVNSVLSDDCLSFNYNIVGDIRSPEIKNSPDAITTWLNNLPWSVEERDVWLGVSSEQLETISLADAKDCLSSIVVLEQ